MSDEAYIEKNAIKITKELQQLKGMDDDDEEDQMRDHVGRRRTIHNLEKQSQKKSEFTNLDDAFRRRISIAPTANLNGIEMNSTP